MLQFMTKKFIFLGMFAAAMMFVYCGGKNDKNSTKTESEETAIPTGGAAVVDDPDWRNLTIRWEGNKCGFVDSTEQWVIAPKYDWAFQNFSEGVVGVLYNDLYGFINSKGEWVIAPQFDEVGWFENGIAVARTRGSNSGIDHHDYLKNRGKCGFIDKSGKFVIAPCYDNANRFFEGLAWVTQNGKCGYIDTTGKVVIDFQFDLSGDFSEGLASAQYPNGKKGYIDKTGKMVIAPQYDYAGDFSNGHAKVGITDGEWDDMKWGMIDQTGKIVIPIGKLPVSKPV